MRYIIPVLVGALIGYITNWLAIKMLFRPHYEKRIFGIKIPFTPGLIPKEKGRIAKNTGETIAKHLITPETIKSALSSDRIDEQLNTWIKYGISRIQNSEATIKSLMNGIEENSYGKFSKIVEDRLVYIIFERLEDESLKNEIQTILYKGIKNEIEKLKTDNRIFNDIISVEIRSNMRIYIKDKGDVIIDTLREILQDPIVKRRLKRTIMDMAEKNLSKMITMFLSPEIIADKGYKILEDYLEEEKTKGNIIMILHTLLDKALENKISHFGEEISNRTSEENIFKLSGIILDKIYYGENKNNYTILLEEKIRTTINKIMDSYGNKPIGKMMPVIDELSMNRISNNIRIVIEKASINKLPELVEALNISKIVEDEINSFDVSYGEEIILDIASKELKAITWLGALLGGIMGIISPLLQLI